MYSHDYNSSNDTVIMQQQQQQQSQLQEQEQEQDHMLQEHEYDQQQHLIIKNVAQDTIRTFTFTDSLSNNNSNEYSYTLEGLVSSKTRVTNISSTTLSLQEQQEQEKQEELTLLEEWSKFCENCFSYKKPYPPASTYFLQHYINDPYNIDLSLIRIARYHNNLNCNTSDNNTNNTTNINPIVASCRLFCKRLSTGYNSTSTTDSNSTTTSTNTSSIIAGGIGEVCTCTNHRKRTLSKQLLEQCISIMIQSNNTIVSTKKTFNNAITTSNTSSTDSLHYNVELEDEQKQKQEQSEIFSVSILHAAPIFFPVYTKLGYCNYTPTYNSILTISLSLLIIESLNSATDKTKKYSIRAPIFPNDTNQLYTIHQQYSESRFRGCIIRTIDYWNNYISQELYNQMYILEEEVPIVPLNKEENDTNSINNKTNTITAGTGTTTKNIVGWIAIRPKYDSNNTILYYQVRDFGFRCSTRTRTTIVSTCTTTTVPSTPHHESYTVFLLLLHYYFMNVIVPESDTKNAITVATTTPRTIKVHIPTPIANDIQQNYIIYRNCNEKSDHTSNIIIDETIETDMGWMYRPIHFSTTNTSSIEKTTSTGGSDNDSNRDTVVSDVTTTGINNDSDPITILNKIFNTSSQHLIWSADSF